MLVVVVVLSEVEMKVGEAVLSGAVMLAVEEVPEGAAM